MIVQFQETRSLSCFLCEEQAVSVCNQETFDTLFFTFSWCHRPFCAQHGVSHQISKDKVPDNVIDHLPTPQKKSIRNQGLNTLPPWVLEKLKPFPEIRMCHHCRQMLISDLSFVKAVLISIGTFAAILCLVLVLQNFIKPATLLCKQNQLPSLALGSCLVKESHERTKQYLEYGEYRSSSKCWGSLDEFHNREVMCACPIWENFDPYRFICRNLTCQILAQSGQCLDAELMVHSKYYNVSEGLTCPIGTIYNAERQACMQTFCPIGYDLGMKGSCIHRFEYWDLTIQKKYPYIITEYAYLPYRGVLKCNRTEKGGKLIPYTDSIGQLHCVHSAPKIVDENGETKYLPEKDLRPCEPNEVLMKHQIGCKYSCPKKHRFNFFTRECVPLECHKRDIYDENFGKCIRCENSLISRLYIQAFSHLEPCYRQQLETWPDDPHV